MSAPKTCLTVYKEIVASKYAPTAITYRLNKGIRDEDVAMCVGCMRMVDSAAGGVITPGIPWISEATLSTSTRSTAWPRPWWTAAPPRIFISSPGTEPLTIMKKEIADKEHKFICLPEEGVCREVTRRGSSQAPSATSRLWHWPRIALRLEEHFRAPQDIEWSIDQAGKIYILQSRPLSSG